MLLRRSYIMKKGTFKYDKLHNKNKAKTKFGILDLLLPAPPINFTTDIPKQKWSVRLYRANYCMMFAHGLAVFAIAITSSIIHPPYTIFLDTLWSKSTLASNLEDAWCCKQRPEECPPTPGAGKNGEEYGTCTGCNSDDILPPYTNDCECKNHTDWGEWLSCENRYVSKWRQDDFAANGEQRLYSPVLHGVTTWKIWVLLLIFEIITCFCHFLCWYWHSTYMRLLSNNMQPIRWMEYHITASIMTVCVCALNRITDIFLVSALFLLGMYLNFSGGLCFETMRFAVRQQIPIGPVHTTMLFTQWYCFFLSWLAFAFQFTCIFSAFYWIIDPYLKLESGHLWGQLFGFVEIVNFGMFGTFAIFPIIHIYQTVGVQFGFENSYFIAEAAYICASLLSKFLLVGSIFYAAIQRENETNSS